MSNIARVAGQAANTLSKPLNVEDVFSTYLYTGTGSAQTITNGIDLSGEGGLVWMKARSTAESNILQDTDGTGVGNILLSNSTSQMISVSGTHLSAFNSNGFSIGTSTDINRSGTTMASWTFRKAPKFFDVVTYTGDGNTSQTVSHNLGSVPGCMIVKRTDASNVWMVYHIGADASAPEDKYGQLNGTNAFQDATTVWNDTAPTSTDFTVGNDSSVNASGGTYVAYVFAHNDGDGGFGPNGDADIIKCGSYTGAGSTDVDVNLGFEPQWLMIKKSSSAGDNWIMFDNMRGVVTGAEDNRLFANLTNTDYGGSDYLEFTSTGFRITGTIGDVASSGATYIYIAIRRGPMAVPTDATDVFDITTHNATVAPAFKSDFPVDFALIKNVTAATSFEAASRLTQSKSLSTSSTAAETSDASYLFNYQDGWRNTTGTFSNLYSWMWKRAPNFFDVVTYTGTGSARTVSHNLGVAPEMMWVKVRSQSYGWITYHESLGNTKYMTLSDTTAEAVYSQNWNNTDPTATEFTLGTNWNVNKSGETFIAYLFASLAGVSKVGSYTGNGSSQTIDCGFSSGARFILIKRTDSTGDWYVWDTERGIVAANDPHLSLNTTAAEVTTDDSIDPVSSGFAVNQVSATNINVSSAEYIFYAIA